MRHHNRKYGSGRHSVVLAIWSRDVGVDAGPNLNLTTMSVLETLSKSSYIVILI